MAVVTILGLAQDASAGIVTNGDFQTGTIFGWTDGGNLGWNTVGAGAGVGGRRL